MNHIMNHSRLVGHGLALFTTVIWGTTFISTKVLLGGFQPVEIIIFRFVLAWLVLFLCAPRPLVPKSLSGELPFIGAGLTGITVYYLLENSALTYTLASNAGIIVSSAPIFTVLLLFLFRKGGRPGLSFLFGFVLAMSGIVLITVSGGGRLELNPLGDLLVLSAAFFWGLYAVCVSSIQASGLSQIQATRKVFFWGLLFLIPVAFFCKADLSPARFAQPVLLGNMLFLALGASAACYLAWNKAITLIGPVATNVYIYLIPVVTLISSALILGEPVTPAAVGAIVLILIGLKFSHRKSETSMQTASEPAEKPFAQTGRKGV